MFDLIVQATEQVVDQPASADVAGCENLPAQIVRLLAVGVCAGAMLAAGLPLAMHAPPYYGGHLVWLFYAAGWMLPMAAIAAIESAVRARHPAPTVPAAIAKQK